MDPITQIHQSLPVTAVCFVGSRLLSGEGRSLSLYDVSKKQKEEEQTIFTAANIHGITPSSCGKYLAVHGSKSLRIIALQETSRLCLECPERCLDDWIWSVQWLEDDRSDTSQPCPPSAPRYLAVALGHNTVAMMDWSTGGVVRQVHCQDKCILYSAHFIGTKWSRLVLAAGTVFNQVVLWPVCPDSQSEASAECSSQSQSRIPVMHRFSGHQGVIFNITTCSSRGLLCSVSDDRSIRLWQISSDSPDTTSTDMTDWTIDAWRAAKFEPLHVLYGHTARVWKALLLKNVIVSIGEDATCLVWNFKGKIMQKIKGHSGRSIWSVACSGDERLVATGGGDASIRISQLESEGVEAARWNSHSAQPCEDKNDYPKTVKFLGSNCVLAVTNSGLVRRYNLHTREWQTLVNDPDFFSYNVIATCPDQKMVAMGNINGIVKIFNNDGESVLEHQVFPGRVFSLVWVTAPNSEDVSNHGNQLLVTGPEGHVALYRVVLPPGIPALHHVVTFLLPPSRQRWVSAASITRHLVICGDRGGSVHVYSVGGGDQPDAILSPTQSLPKIHGKVGVTGVVCSGDTVYTSGRDGHYRTYTATTGGLRPLQAHRLIKGWDWLSRIFFIGTDLYLLGFHMEQFVVYDVSKSEILITIPCGGGHRGWDFTHSLEGATGDNHSPGGSVTALHGYFVYIKNREVVICDTDIRNTSLVIKPALHGKDINDVVPVFPDVKDPSSQDGSTILVTAGEDGQLQLVSIDNAGSRELAVLSTLQGHISSVRCLATSPSRLSDHTSRCTVLLSGGGRAQLLAWRIWLHNDSAILSCFPEHLSSHTVIDDGGIRKKKSWKSRDTVVDPETRVMSLDAFSLAVLDKNLPEHLHCVTVGCSDGLLRIFIFNEVDYTLKLLTQSNFHDHCVLRIKHFILSSANQKRALVLSAATDGQVAIWDVTKIICDTFGDDSRTASSSANVMKSSKSSDDQDLGLVAGVVKCHQSGVNSMDIKQILDGTYMLVTGGDDNAVHLSTLNMTVTSEGEVKVKVGGSATKADAHSAQVTGVTILDDDNILSVSIDQRAIWWTVDRTTLQLTQKSSRWLSVADVSQLAVWRTLAGHVRATVSGIGLEVLSLDL